MVNILLSALLLFQAFAYVHFPRWGTIVLAFVAGVSASSGVLTIVEH